MNTHGVNKITHTCIMTVTVTLHGERAALNKLAVQLANLNEIDLRQLGIDGKMLITPIASMTHASPTGDAEEVHIHHEKYNS